MKTPVTPTYPGVYIEELPSAARTITGVSTSITAFVGRALRGPTDKVTLIHSFADYVRIFGGLWKESNMSYAVYHYFLNGGTDAIIVRAHRDAKAAIFEKDNLQLKASNPGSWGEELKITVNQDVDDEKLANDDTLFNIIIEDKKTGANETFLNLSAKQDSPRFITRVLEEESNLVRVEGDVPLNQPTAGEFGYEADSSSDGEPLTATEINGDPAAKTGIYALDNADIFNLLCIPTFHEEDDTDDRMAAYTTAVTYCEKRRAMLLIDPPSEWNTKEKAKTGIDDIGLDRHKNAAIFFPRIKAPDPNEEYRMREFVPCGAVAGVIARTDGQRGVWKAPAGIEATLIGVPDLTIRLTDEENGDLNPLGINCLRVLPSVGRVVWGARTLRGADRLADQWKYLPVRRMALYIEESLYRGTQWVVFEPNDEKLWSQIRLNVGAFMHDLFTRGAFQGTDPKKAYFVKCDSETTTQYDIDRGIVNIIVGFAPLKPAEFVILKIQQIAGQEGE